ncbi:MAG: HAD family phosphatase [Thermodesulfobacteriota bacterium]
MKDQRVSDVSTILFDLGGVLFQLSGAAIVCQWTRDRLTPPELMNKWLVSPAVRAFESGRIGFAEFRAQLKEELKLAVTDDEFTTVFNGWITGVFPGAEDLLERLSSRYGLACFSNTNAVHWEILTGDYAVLDFFDHTFASFQMGLVKPDAEAFAYVVEKLGVPAGSIVFLDDSQPNVEAALDCGLRAFRVAGVAGVASALTDAGLL